MAEDRLWHQVVRDGNYEQLESSEAEAVATAATAILSRPESSGSRSLEDHRKYYSSLGYEVSLKGWDTEPPHPLDEAGGLNVSQVHTIVRRALDTGNKHIRSRLVTADKKPTTPAANSDALDRIRKRLREQREKETD